MVRNQPGASLREFGDASAGAACAAVEKRPTHPFCTEVPFEVKEDILNFETILELMHSLKLTGCSKERSDAVPKDPGTLEDPAPHGRRKKGETTGRMTPPAGGVQD